MFSREGSEPLVRHAHGGVEGSCPCTAGVAGLG